MHGKQQEIMWIVELLKMQVNKINNEVQFAAMSEIHFLAPQLRCIKNISMVPSAI